MVEDKIFSKSLLQYLAMSKAELSDLIEEFPFYSLPRLAQYLITGKGKDDIALYAYDMDIVNKLRKIASKDGVAKLIENIAKEQLEKPSKEEPITTSSQPIEKSTKKTEKKKPIDAKEVKKIDTSKEEASIEIEKSNLTDEIEFGFEEKSITKKTGRKPKIVKREQVIDLTEESKVNPVKKTKKSTKKVSNKKTTKEKVKEKNPISKKETKTEKPRLKPKAVKKTSKKVEAPKTEPKLTKKTKATKIIKKKAVKATKKSVKKPEVKKKIDKVETKAEQDFFQWLNTTQNNTSEVKKKVNKSLASTSKIKLDEDLEELIDDKFIDKFKGSKEQKAVKLLSENEVDDVKEVEIYSENLAVLYENQGHKEKAIEIYKKLIEQNPEKSAYFVDRLKKLK